MIDAVVFNGIHALDFADVRTNVIRIPEVSARIFEAQALWDRSENSGFNFLNYILSDEKIFLSNLRLKSLISGIIQVGLFDRYRRQNPQPKFMVGIANGDSALHVCSGQVSFADMVVSSKLSQSRRTAGASVLHLAEDPVLTGIGLAEMGAYVRNAEGDYDLLEVDKFEMKKVIVRLINDFEVKKFINIGPGAHVFQNLQQDLALTEVQILESISLDPMLNWFWPQLRLQPEALVI